LRLPRAAWAGAVVLGSSLVAVAPATAATPLERTLVDAPPALRALTAGADALQGQQPDDLSRLVAAGDALATGLAPHRRQLAGAVRGLDQTTAALTADHGALAETLRELPPTLRRADAAFTALDAALPGVRRLADQLLPGVRESGGAIDASLPWMRAARDLTRADGLPRLLDELEPTVPLLTRLAAQGQRLAPPLDAAAMCVYKVLVPAAGAKVEDGKLTTGREVYKSLGYAAVGLAGIGQNRDANGAYLRFGSGLGSGLLDLGPSTAAGRLLSTTGSSPIGVRPVRPAGQPPQRDDRACDAQPVPDPNRAMSAPGEASAVVGRARSAAAREQGPTAEGSPRGLGASRDRLGTGLADRLNPLSGRPPTARPGTTGGGR
jgi:hypothetical protein